MRTNCRPACRGSNAERSAGNKSEGDDKRVKNRGENRIGREGGKEILEKANGEIVSGARDYVPTVTYICTERIQLRYRKRGSL